jgi:hypothetical protein
MEYVNIEETAEALHRLYKQGRIRAIRARADERRREMDERGSAQLPSASSALLPHHSNPERH